MKYINGTILCPRYTRRRGGGRRVREHGDYGGSRGRERGHVMNVTVVVYVAVVDEVTMDVMIVVGWSWM